MKLFTHIAQVSIVSWHARSWRIILLRETPKFYIEWGNTYPRRFPKKAFKPGEQEVYANATKPYGYARYVLDVTTLREATLQDHIDYLVKQHKLKRSYVVGADKQIVDTMGKLQTLQTQQRELVDEADKVEAALRALQEKQDKE